MALLLPRALLTIPATTLPSIIKVRLTQEPCIPLQACWSPAVRALPSLSLTCEMQEALRSPGGDSREAEGVGAGVGGTPDLLTSKAVRDVRARRA